MFSSCRNGCLFNSLFFKVISSVALWPFWKFFKLLWFLADRLSPSCFAFSSSQKSLNKNILGSECYSHKQSPRIKQWPSPYWIPCFPQYTSVSPRIPSRFGVVVWAVRTVAADYVRLCACVCFDRPSQKAARDLKWPKTAPNVLFSSRDFLPELFVCFLWRIPLGSGPPGFVK